MEAIGQLTGGVAHDFNNLLTIIVGNLDMIVRALENRSCVERLANSGLQAARRGAEVTEKLLAFSRRQVLRLETVNPNRLLNDFQLLRRAVGEMIEVRLELDASVDPVRLDPNQFENAIPNLAVNARDAMLGMGTLTIRTSNSSATASKLAGRADLRPGDDVVVRISDTGVGMDEATLAHAFEPFFTTKDIGKGTSLGLSQVYGFVRQAGAAPPYAASRGAGPWSRCCCRARPSSPPRGPRKPPSPCGGPPRAKSFLVVEDEPAVLEMALESLSQLGYRTLTATQANAALERLRGPESIDILFSDVAMPGGINGVQLSVEARRLQPGLHVLLISGYTGTALVDQSVPDDLPLLGKPYRREELADKLRMVMARAS